MQITDQINTANGQTCTYGYDDLTRITSANCGSVWAQTFSLDPFGNLSKSGSASFQPTYTGASGTGTTPSNQYYSIPNGGAGTSNYYDTNGNLKNDVTNSYTWDADGNMLSVGGSTSVTMIYDALDRMIEQTRGSSHTEIAYGPYGLKLALMNGQTLVNAFVKLPGGSRAVYGASGLAYYRHSDHLGSSRLATTPSRTKYYDVAYAPYGEDYNGSGTTPDLAFTDENQDTVKGGSSSWSSNLYDFMLREYRTAHGRWTQPDPAGQGAVDPTNPQTWNRYAYVLNNPMAMVDLLGDDGCYDGSDDPSCYDAGYGWGNDGWWGSTIGGPVFDGSVYVIRIQVNAPMPTGPGTNPDPNTGYTCISASGSFQASSCPTIPTVNPPPNNGCPPGQNCSGQSGGSAANNGQQPDPAKVRNSMLQMLWKPALGAVCGNSVATPVLKSMRNGAIVGAASGAYTGFVSCEVLFGTVSLGTSGAAGAGAGAVVGGVFGAGRGVFTGTVMAGICQAAGAY